MFSKVVDVTNHCVCSHVAGFIASMLVFLKARIHREYARLPQGSLARFARSLVAVAVAVAVGRWVAGIVVVVVAAAAGGGSRHNAGESCRRSSHFPRLP